MASISDIKCSDLTNEGNAQIYALCAANHRSTLRILRHGLAVSELAVSDLPATPNVIYINWLTYSGDMDHQGSRGVRISQTDSPFLQIIVIGAVSRGKGDRGAGLRS